VLLIFGEEDFLIEEAVTKLIHYLLKGYSSSQDYEIIDCDEADADRLTNSCTPYPFLSSHRVVLAKRVEKLYPGTSARKNYQNTGFYHYLQNPQPTTFLIMTASVDSLNGLGKMCANNTPSDKAKKLIESTRFPFGVILQKYEWMEFPKVYESEYPNWIINRMKSYGKSINHVAANLIVTGTNPNLYEIDAELQKILLYVMDKKEITIDDVTECIGNSRSFNVFELQKAVGKRQLGDAFRIIENILATDRQEVLIITILTRFFIALWRLIEESAKTTNQYQLAAAIGVSPFFVKEYQEAAKNYSPTELDKCFSILNWADEKLKSTSTDGLYVLQRMLTEIMDR
jgi:DNA polymerase-3 subunit delta